MKINLLSFGKSRDYTGHRKMELDIPDACTVAQLRRFLSAKFPGLDERLGYSIAVNETYAGNDEIVSENAEVALIPPVSGG